MSVQETLFHWAVNAFYKFKPQREPTKEKLLNCKIISHRGEFDNKTIFENTLEAFDKVLKAGIWGIEFDIRWTKDLIPMVFHDEDLERLFSSKICIADINFQELRDYFPLIPSLAEAVDQFGGKVHLMIELKKENYPAPAVQMERLKKIFEKLTPGKDFHIISIYPEMFEPFDFLPTQAFLPITLLGYEKISQLSLEKKYGGVLGHFLFLSPQRILRHSQSSQKVGTAFINSKNSMYREINRDVDWLFSDCAADLQAHIKSKL